MNLVSQKIRKAGHKIFLLDEEGVVTYDIFLREIIAIMKKQSHL